jgi:hypothetical protein
MMAVYATGPRGGHSIPAIRLIEVELRGCSSSSVSWQRPQASLSSQQFAITEVNIVDVTSGQITPARTVVINDDVVSEITGSAPPPGTKPSTGSASS